MNNVIRFSPLQLALAYVAFGIGALILFAAPLWYAWQVTIEDGRREVLKEDAQRLVNVFKRSGADGLTAFVNERVGLQIADERILLVTDASLKPLAGNLGAWPHTVPSLPGAYTATIYLGTRPARVSLVYAALPGGYRVLVGRDTAKYAPLQTRFWYGLAGTVAVLVVVGALGGIFIQRALLLRIQSVQHTVSAIMQGDLGHRLPMRPGGDELDTLSHTINRMLDQIEQLVNGIRNVSNSIAHDLRTPLAELRSRLEELSVTRPSTAETFAEIDAAVADVDRVIGIFNALLRLAEIDAGMRRSGFIQVNASRIAAEAVEFYLPAAELKGVSLSYVDTGPGHLPGDPVLLAQAIGNLIDNALKYAPEQGVITVEAHQTTEQILEIAVSDNGPGISDAEKPKVAQRFYRGDASRGTPGVGLGLSLAEAVARLHGGVLGFKDNHPGLRVCMVLDAGTSTSILHADASVEQAATVGFSSSSPA